MDISRHMWSILPSICTKLFEPSFLLLTILLATITYYFLSQSDRDDSLPIINRPKWYQPNFIKRLQFPFSALDELCEARKISKGTPFRMLTLWGEATVLPPEYIKMICNEPDLSLPEFQAHAFHGRTPGFKPFGLLDDNPELVHHIITKHITRRLNTIATRISSEAEFALRSILGDSSDWQETTVVPSMEDLAARLISCAFLGADFCRDQRWLRFMKGYSKHLFIGAFKLHIFPPLLRPLIHWFIPECRKVRQGYNDVRKLIESVLAMRHGLQGNSGDGNQSAISSINALEWVEAESNGKPYDAAAVLLFLTVASLQSTTNLLANVMGLLANHPEHLETLRNEMLETLGRDTQKTGAVNDLKCLDSFLKEAQRTRPVATFPMNRIATKDVALSNGFTIRKGERVLVDGSNMSKLQCYENPEDFDINRFSNLHEGLDFDSSSLFVSTSSEHLGFGHGIHACPGRFFVAREIKIALCHLVLSYDWKLAPNSDVAPRVLGLATVANPDLKLVFRRQNIELDLASLSL